MKGSAPQPQALARKRRVPVTLCRPTRPAKSVALSTLCAAFLVWAFVQGWTLSGTSSVQAGRAHVRVRTLPGFQGRPEYKHFRRALRAQDHPWQRAPRRCGWWLWVGLSARGKVTFRYGPFYRYFSLPSQASDPKTRATTLLLTLALFWEGAQQEHQAGALSCRLRTRKSVGPSEGPPPRVPPLRRPPPRRTKVRQPPPKRTFTRRPPPRRKASVRETPPRRKPLLRKPPKRTLTRRPPPRRVKKRRVAQRPPSRPRKKPPSKKKPLHPTLGLLGGVWIPFDRPVLWGGGLRLLFWEQHTWRLRVEFFGAFRLFDQENRLFFGQTSVMADLVAWRWRTLSQSFHLGLALAVSWIERGEGRILWLTPGLQGGTSLAWRFTKHLILTLRVDALLLPFRDLQSESGATAGLSLFYLIPQVGLAWRF